MNYIEKEDFVKNNNIETCLEHREELGDMLYEHPDFPRDINLIYNVRDKLTVLRLVTFDELLSLEYENDYMYAYSGFMHKDVTKEFIEENSHYENLPWFNIIWHMKNNNRTDLEYLLHKYNALDDKICNNMYEKYKNNTLSNAIGIFYEQYN